MTEFYALPRRPPRIWAFVDDIKAKLRATPAVVTAVGNANNIYKSTDNYSLPPAGATEQTLWTRVVILPVTTLWQAAETPGQDRVVPFVVRAELHAPSDPNYDPSRKLESIHEEIFMALHGWRPGDKQYYRVQSEVYRALTPQTQPEYDETRGLWLNSAQYKAHVSPPAIAVMVGIVLTPASATLLVGQKQQFTVKAQFSGGAPEQNVTNVAHYNYSGGTMTPGGLFTATTPGTWAVGADWGPPEDEYMFGDSSIVTIT